MVKIDIEISNIVYGENFNQNVAYFIMKIYDIYPAKDHSSISSSKQALGDNNNNINIFEI
jgi:hypothetical protein